MFKHYRSSRLALVGAFALITVVSASVMTMTAANANPRSVAFIDSTTDVFELSKDSDSGWAPAPPPPICPPVWTAMAPIPTGANSPQLRYGFVQTATDFYLVGGLNGSFAVTGGLLRYNIATDTWTPLATAPSTINQNPSAAIWNGKIYAIGGLNGAPTTTVQIYDIASNTWSAGAPIPAGTYGAAAGAFNNKVFVAGGSDPGGANPTTALQVYDIATNSWSAGTALPAPGYLSGGYTQSGQYLYLAGGFTATPTANTTETVRLDMTSSPGVWTSGPTFTPARADFGLAASGTKLYAIGGDANGGGFFDFSTAVDELDTTAWPAGAWVASPTVLPSARQANEAGFSTATGLWSTGGYNGTPVAEHLVRGNGIGCGSTAPVVTAGASGQSANEGSSTSWNLGSFVDPDGGPWTVVVTWGDGLTDTFAAASAGTIAGPNHTYAQSGIYTVNVQVTDTGALSDNKSFQVTINNVAPTVSTPTVAPTSTSEGASTSFTVSGTFTDPAGALDQPFTAVVNWGDGSTSTATVSGAANPFSYSFSGTHTYAQSGVYSVTVSVTDKDGGTGTSAAASVSVANAAPTVSTPTVAPTNANQGVSTAFTVSGTFTDPAGALDQPFTAVVNWGDGSTSTAIVSGAANPFSYSFSGTHTYALGGVYSVTVSVTDKDGGTGTSAATVVNVNLVANLAITKTDGVTSTPAGSTVTYTITAANAGPSNAPGSTVVDTFPAAITNAQWTCAGAGCTTLSGTGNINQVVNLAVGGTVTYTVAATISPSATGILTNTATVAPPVGTTDPVLGNNTAADVDTLTAPSVFVIDDVQKLEGQSGTTPFVFTVSKNGGTGFATAVQFQTQDGTATVADNDYQAASGTLNFAPFDTSKTITVLVNGDANIEPNETFFVRLLPNPVNALLFDGGGQGTIINDDPAATPTPTPVPTPTPTPAPPNFEGDINRIAVGVPGTGNGDVNVGDQIQYLKFLNGTDCPSANEQPRLDAGPRISLGDGLLGAADGTAIDAYARHDAATDFDPNTPGWQPTPAGGPATITNLGCTPSAAPESEDVSNATPVEPASASAARVVRVVSRSGARSSDITVDIEMTAQGNEAGTQYGLHFDPSVLSISSVSGVNTNPDIALGAGAPTGTTLNVNADDAANGNIGIVENFNGAAASISAIPAEATRIARLRFHVLDGAASGTSRVDFDTSVINGVTSDVNGMVLSANYEGGDVSVSASRGVTVSGRVTSSDGRGIRGATVTIVDGDGLTKTATTSAFGYYTFDDVAAATYTIAVSSRQYHYSSRRIEVGDNLADVNFIGLE